MTSKPFKAKRKPIYDEDSGVPPTQEQIDRMVKQANNVIQYWLNRSEQTRANLFKKVRAKGIPQDIIDSVLNKYEEANLVNDARYAQYFVDYKLKYDKLAKYTLSQKLREKGIDREIIEEVLSAIEDDTIEDNAKQLVLKRLVSSRKHEPQKRIKSLADMLVRKGYPVGLAFRIVKEVIQEEEADFEAPDDESMNYE